MVGSSDVLADLRVNVMLEGRRRCFGSRNASWKTRKSSSTRSATKRGGSTGRCTGRATGGTSASARLPARRLHPSTPKLAPPARRAAVGVAHEFAYNTYADLNTLALSRSSTVSSNRETDTSHNHQRRPPTPTASAPSLVVHPPTPASVHARLEQAQAAQQASRHERAPAQVPCCLGCVSFLRSTPFLSR
ncbi:hypothetical protein K438DRAFT_578406 [Mycena galopus ATCC 62051]|nr:hypothetical protein K438DRAFT_578406 [Mycena galopus ATCC 62051]